MSNPAYFFINTTRKEFIFFSKNISIVKALQDAITSSQGWTTEDDIRIGQDEEAINYLDTHRYTISKKN